MKIQIRADFLAERFDYTADAVITLGCDEPEGIAALTADEIRSAVSEALAHPDQTTALRDVARFGGCRESVSGGQVMWRSRHPQLGRVPFLVVSL